MVKKKFAMIHLDNEEEEEGDVCWEKEVVHGFISCPVYIILLVSVCAIWCTVNKRKRRPSKKRIKKTSRREEKVTSLLLKDTVILDFNYWTTIFIRAVNPFGVVDSFFCQLPCLHSPSSVSVAAVVLCPISSHRCKFTACHGTIFTTACWMAEFFY